MAFIIKPFQSFIVFFVLISCLSCSKSSSETGAEKVSGIYSGFMNSSLQNNSGASYSGDYKLKVEQSSNGKIRISCMSAPTVFESFEMIIIYANGTVTSEYQDKRLFYQNITTKLSLNIYGSPGAASFDGYKVP